ncbi:tetratricopeptide repeat protein [Pontixanthobacter aestiaquae]|nr:tetratricopeptide repeat protein [Pontixanthobacter aestiaquae]MDN3646649.1 tetratricopeptide repeat protein [Pontixanthobacter aestiaquae]
MLKPVLVIACLAAATPMAGCSELQTDYLAEGREAYESGEFSRARIHLLQYLDGNPDDGAARILLAKVLLEIGDGVGAMRFLEQIADDSELRNEAKSLIPEARLLEGQYKMVLELTEEVSGPFSANMAWARAFAQVGLDRVEAAMDTIDAALRQTPKDIRLLLLKGNILLADGKVAQAHSVVRQLSANEPDNVRVMLLAGRVALARGNESEARKLFSRAVELQPDNSVTYAMLGDTYRQSGEMDKARENYERSLQLLPGNAKVLISLAELELFEGNVDLAHQILQNSRMRVQSLPLAMRLEGLIATERGMHETALTKLERYIRDNPTDPIALSALGRTYEALGETEKMNNIEQVLAKLDPSDSDLEIAVQRSDGTLRSELDKANQALARQDWRAADAVYSKLVNRPGMDNPVVFNNAAMVKLQLENLPAALAMAEKAYRLAPNDPFVQDSLGWTLFLNGKQPDRAAKLLTRAYEANPDNSEISWHLAQVLASTGRKADAVALMERLKPNLSPADRAKIDTLIARL